MARGRNICNTLKAIRKQIADANGIEYSPEECHFKGECKGTCPKCEQEVRNLEYELKLRKMSGNAVKIAGIAAGVVVMTACSDGKPQRNVSDQITGDTTIEEVAPPDPKEIRGDISASFVDKEKLIKEENRKEGEAAYNPALETKEPNDKRTNKGYHSKNQGKNAVTKSSAESDKILGAAEEMASFPGGTAALMQYIKDNLCYPKECLEGAATGRVLIGFTVNKDGSLSDTTVLKSLDPILDKEAIRVVKSMPKWNSAKLNGKAVKSKYTVPVKFRIE